jgi:hypothetical protein
MSRKAVERVETMWDRPGALSRFWLSLLGKALGALALSAAVITPIEVLGTEPAGATPTISFLLAANAKGPTTTISGTVFLDAGITPTPGSHIIDVEYELVPIAPIECDPPRLPCTPIPLTGTPAVEPTLVGWLGEWNSTAAANGPWQLEVLAEEADNVTGTVSSTTYAPITITVDNTTPPMTSVVLPTNGATLSGTQYLDAGASPGVTQVHYVLSGGPDNFANQLLAFATPTYYGWIGSWDTTSVPNGTYILQSYACYGGGVCGGSSGITINVDNVPLATQLLLPQGGSDISGTVVFDASAQGANITGVYFVVTFGPLNQYRFLTATLTYYGWIGQWNSAACPPGYANGAYVFQSVVTQSGGATAMSAPVDVTLDNAGGCP